MSQTPNRSPTHREIDMGKLANLGMDVEALAEDGPLTPDRIIEAAQEQGKPPSHYYAAVALASELELPTAPVTAVFCAGKCQSWGALDNIDAAVAAWEQRPGAFAIGVRTCLDKCADAPVCELRTPSGTATILRGKPDEIARAITDALDSV